MLCPTPWMTFKKWLLLHHQVPCIIAIFWHFTQHRFLLFKPMCVYTTQNKNMDSEIGRNHSFMRRCWSLPVCPSLPWKLVLHPLSKSSLTSSRLFPVVQALQTSILYHLRQYKKWVKASDFSRWHVYFHTSVTFCCMKRKLWSKGPHLLMLPHGHLSIIHILHRRD